MTNPIGRYRWTICALLFFATTINYLDRAVISLVKEYLDVEFNWTKSDYANITVAFQASYALAMVFVGRVIDLLGTKTGYALSLLSWSIAAMGHYFVTGNFGFYMARIGLGVTESGNFPAAVKTVTEWFPKKERAFATGIFNAGTNVGAIIAPLSVPFIAAAYGWRLTFVFAGAIGLIWLIFWYWLYDTPRRQKRLAAEEFAHIHSDTDEEQSVHNEPVGKTPWAKLLRIKHTWAYASGKFLTDGIWWFYLFWLPDFLKEEYQLTKTDLALPVAAVYVLATIGSVFGGWLPMYFIAKGWPVFRARKTSMLIYAFCVLPVVFSQIAGSVNMWFAIFIIGFAAAAHQAWSANIYTTVSDALPKRVVASVIGFGGMTGTFGAVIIAKLAGWLFDHYKGLGHIEKGYYIMFVISGLAYLTAWSVMHFLVPRLEKVSV
jgi:ACS family hexuronate transporter-like MFS transporter